MSDRLTVVAAGVRRPVAIVVSVLLSVTSLFAQSQPRPGVGPADRPKVDAAGADRGRHLWAAECITCHGAQARGTDAGPNLIRSQVVLRDRYGSTLGPFLKKGHPLQSGAAASSLTGEQVTDLTHFLRQRIEDTLRGSAAFVPQDVVTGRAAVGAAYFNGSGGCTSCHSATGDLAHLAARITDPVDIQQRMLFPTGRGRGAGPGPGAIRVTLTPAAGAPQSGVLVQMDDFYVAFRDDTGALRVVKRSPELHVVKTDPLQAHHDLLRQITDDQIHDLVAYLVTLK
jgi:mono/diheme cytochrome c family protein